MKCFLEKISKLYYIIFVIFLCASLFGLVSIAGNTYISLAIKCIRYLCYLYFGLILVINYKKLSYIDLFLLFVSLIVTYFSRNKFIITTLLIIISVKNYDLKKVFRLAFYTSLIMFSLTVFLSLFNVIPDWIFPKEDTIRHALGFIYPTDCFSIYLAIVLLYFASHKDDYHISWIIVLELLNIVMYLYTAGRLSFYLINITIIIMCLLKIKNLRKILSRLLEFKIIKVLAFSFPFLLLATFISIVFAFKSENINIKAYANKADIILSGRVFYTAKAFDEHRITAFGEPIEWFGWGGKGYDSKVSNNNTFEYNFVDSSYPRILFDFGIVFTIIILTGYSLLLMHYIKNNDLVMFSIIIIVLIWALIEPSIVDIQKNLLILSFSSLLGCHYIFKKNRVDKNEKN